MKNNIDEHIKLLEEYLKCMRDVPVGANVCVLWAIENVLSELKQKNEELDVERKLTEYNNMIIKELKSELETYKKIAEKLAEELYMTSNNCCCQECEELCPEINPKSKQCIIDWARKEVEK